LVIDRQTWLTASFSSTGGDKLPCGWWSDDPSLALIMGASLAAAMEETVDISIEIPPVEIIEPEPEVELLPEPEVVMEEPVSEPVVDPEPEPEVEKIPEPEVKDNEEDDDDGIQFIIRHDDDDDDKPLSS